MIIKSKNKQEFINCTKESKNIVLRCNKSVPTDSVFSLAPCLTVMVSRS